MDKLDIKKENRHTRLLELGVGTRDELIESISNKFMYGIIKNIRQDTGYHFRIQNKKYFENALIRSSKDHVKNFISSLDKEYLEKLLTEINKNETN